MADMRAIKARLQSIGNVGQISKSLKTVSAAKLRHVQARLDGVQTFSRHCTDIFQEIAGSGAGTDNCFVAPHSKNETVCYFIFVGNRGLCGSYNTALVKHLAALIKDETRNVLVASAGRWGAEYLAAEGISPCRRFTDISDTPTPEEGRELAEYFKELYSSGQADEIVLVYQRCVNVLSQVPNSMTLLPLQAESATKKSSEYLFEPDRATLIEKLVQLDIDNTVYSVLLEAKKGEHSARMNTMSAAADNTDELMNELMLELNHLRQSQITTELAEMMGGSCGIDRQ